MNLSLDALHKLGLYAVTLVAFLATAIGGGVELWMLAAFPVGVLLSTLRRPPQAGTSQGNIWNVLVFVALGLTVADLFRENADLATAGIRFILILALIKFWSRAGDRDDLQIFALSFMTLAAASVVNDGISYGLLFAVYVLTGTFSLAVFHLRSETARQPVGLTSRRGPMDRTYAAVLAGLSLAIFAASLAIFFTFPRVGLGFFVRQSREAVQMTGFSDTVELGDHGLLRDNPEVVMRVEFPGGTPEGLEGLHWRTMAFDHYDGRAWKRTISGSERPLRSANNTYDLGPLLPVELREAARQAPELTARIYLEPLGTNLMPHPWPTSHLTLGQADPRLPWNPRMGTVTADAYGDLRHTTESQLGVLYLVHARTLPDPSELPSWPIEGLAEEFQSYYLQTPALAPRVRELAQRITQGATTPMAKALAVEAWLETNLAYTTQLPEVNPQTPVESFLFDTRRGHCEYFATAAVMLLREAGVPARLVNGFLGGSWNPVGGYLAVRQGDAHSWIEVYSPPLGWVPIDPTPPTESPLSGRHKAWQWLTDSVDALRMNWHKWVIEYDLSAQIEVARNLARALSPKGRSLDEDARDARDDKGPRYRLDPRTMREATPWLGLVAVSVVAWRHGGRRRQGATSKERLAFAGLWAIAAALWLGTAWHLLALEWHTWQWATSLVPALASWGGRPSARARTNPMQEAVSAQFARIEARARKLGEVRAEDEGPGHFMERLGQRFPEAATDLAWFRERYQQTRFGGRELQPRDLAALAKAARRIAKALRRHK